MLSLDSLERVLWLLQTLVFGVLALRLLGQGLYRTYNWFFAYLVANLIQLGVLFCLPRNTETYAWAWVYTIPFIWFLSILIVLELYSLVLRDYQGILSLGRWTLFAALLISLTIAVLSLRPDLANPDTRFPILRMYALIQRGVYSSLVIFLVLITGFLAFYPIPPLRRNVIVYCAVYFVLFTSKSIAFFARDIGGPDVTAAINVGDLAVETLCLIVWIAFLNRTGETRTTALAYGRLAPDRERQMVELLISINDRLLRASRK